MIREELQDYISTFLIFLNLFLKDNINNKIILQDFVLDILKIPCTMHLIGYYKEIDIKTLC